VGIRDRWAINGALLGLLCSAGAAQQGAGPRAIPLAVIVQSVEKAQAGARRPVSYQIIREYRLFGANDSRVNSDVVAEINFRPPDSRNYSIQKSSGSSRGTQLVRRILDHEVATASKDNKSSRAISSDNYNFDYLGEGMLNGQRCYVLGMKPKRAGTDLIAGQAWVDERSFQIRQIQGDMEKTPSWWLKKVHVKLDFADREGTWVQTNMEATADVRLVGTHTLTSRLLDYRKESEVAVTPTPARRTMRKR
jgi:hypothetical protein